jgi:hypothetical protein
VIAVDNLKVKNQILSKTRSGKLLRPLLKDSLFNYLKTVIPEEYPANDFSQPYRNHVTNSLKSVLKEQHIKNIEKLIKEFELSPVIQSGEHSGLLFNHENFMLNWLFYIASREKKREYMLSWQCSKVNCVTDKANLYGPGYIKINSEIYKLFDNINYLLSRTKLFHSNIAALNDVVFVFEPQKRNHISSSTALPAQLEFLRGKYFQSASDAFIYANKNIWSELNLIHKPELIQIDDSFGAEVIIENLKDSSSLIHKLLFNQTIRNAYLNAKERVVNSDQNLTLRNTSDFFYAKRHNRLDPLKIKNDLFINSRTGEKTEIILDPDELIKHLRQKDVYCDLSLSYTFTFILPNILALAGTSQQEYLTPMKNILLMSNINNTLFNETTSNNIKSQKNCSLINASLLELPQKEISLLEQLDRTLDLSQLEYDFVNKPIEETLGSFSKFRYMTTLNIDKYNPID